MKQPLFLRDADQLEAWLQRFNPLAGATLETVAGYIDEAEEGRFANLAWFARKLVRRDETIRACMRRISSTVMKLDWQVKVMTTLPKGVTPQQAEAQQKRLQQRYEQVENLKGAYAFSAQGDFWGFAHLEKHYGPDGWVTRLQPVPAWHWMRHGIYGPWSYNAKGSMWPRDAVEIDAAHFVSREIDDPWIEIACIHGLRKNQGDRDWDGFMARYGIPNTFFEAPVGASDDDMKDYQAMASDLAADGTGTLPNGAKPHVFETSQTGEVFDGKIKRHDSAIVLAATGGLLTMLTESGSGTLAGGAHAETWRELVSGIASDVAESFQGSLDKAWLAEDFPGQPVAAYFDLDFPEEKKDRKGVVETLNGLKRAGYRVKREWVEEESGVPLEDGEITPPASRKQPLKNRFTGGPTAARDRAEAMQLAEATLSDVMQVTAETFAPLQPDILRLIELAEDDSASAEEFAALAAKVGALLPELVTPERIQALADELEKGFGSAAALGARANIRKRAKANAAHA